MAITAAAGGDTNNWPVVGGVGTGSATSPAIETVAITVAKAGDIAGAPQGYVLCNNAACPARVPVGTEISLTAKIFNANRVITWSFDPNYTCRNFIYDNTQCLITPLSGKDINQRDAQY